MRGPRDLESDVCPDERQAGSRIGPLSHLNVPKLNQIIEVVCRSTLVVL